MDLIDKYLIEANKEYIHVIDDNGEFNVMHSVHNSPQLGGQVMKTFKSKKKAIEFAFKIQKKEIILSWKQKGNRATGATWSKEGIHATVRQLKGK